MPLILNQVFKILAYIGAMIRVVLMLLLAVGIFNTVTAQQEFKLYPGEIPNAKRTKDASYTAANSEVDSLAFKVSIPTITIYKPAKANGTAVIICPGGGYHTLLVKREGSDVARAFNKLGITALVLKYRLPSDLTMQNKAEGPLQDVQQAIRFVRGRAVEWGIQTDQIGVMGFSAGGHVASSAGTNLVAGARPDFMLLINPVISFNDSIGHGGSRKNLLGDRPSAAQIKRFSNELQVTKDTPAAFLVHSSADQVVLAENSLVFYRALKELSIPVGMHLYAKGEHGFLTAPSFEEWFGRCEYWLRSMMLL